MAGTRPRLAPRRLLTLAAWGLAAYVTWLAYAWLALGWWALPALAAAHAVDGWRAARDPSAPALPPRRPRHMGVAAAQVVGGIALAALVGYRPDWLIAGGLGASALVRLGDDAPGGRDANSGAGR